jgi:hypothetical protein
LREGKWREKGRVFAKYYVVTKIYTGGLGGVVRKTVIEATFE